MIDDAVPDLPPVTQTLFEELPSGLVIFSTDLSHVHANAAALKVFGSDHAVRGFLADHADDLKRALALERGCSVDLEAAFRRGDGREAQLMVEVFPVGESGAAVVRDVSADRVSEREFVASQQRFRSLFEHQTDAVVMIAYSGAIVTFNAATTRLLGHEIEELVDVPFVSLFAHEDRDRARDHFERALGGESTTEHAVLVAKNGDRIDVTAHLLPVMVEGRYDGAYLVATDLRPQRDAERAALAQAERLRALYLAAAAGGSGSDRLVETLQLGLRLLGFDYAFVAQIEGDDAVVRYATKRSRYEVGYQANVADLYLRHMLKAQRVLAVADRERAPWSEDSASAERPWRALIAAPIVVYGNGYGAIAFASETPREIIGETDKDLVGMMGALCASVIERMDHDQRLDSLAFFDTLTGLPNRVLLGDRLTQTVISSRRLKRQFALMYLDLDNFKRVNDDHGQLAGDQVLQIVAKRLSKALRESDTVARMGGDEFVIIQPTISSPADAFELARRVISEVEEPIRLTDAVVEVSVSIGVAFFPEDAEDADTLLRCADIALYRAKADGRGRASAYVPAD